MQELPGVDDNFNPLLLWAIQSGQNKTL